MANRRSIFAVLALVGSVGMAAAQSPPTALEVYPPDINLETSRDRQSFVVQAWFADGLSRDVTATCQRFGVPRGGHPGASYEAMAATLRGAGP